MAYTIRFDDGTNAHLARLTARQRALVFDAIERQLLHKHMQADKPGFVAPWELRVGDLRVYYDVEDGPPATVVVVAVGVKTRNRVRIGDQEHET